MPVTMAYMAVCTMGICTWIGLPILRVRVPLVMYLVTHCTFKTTTMDMVGLILRQTLDWPRQVNMHRPTPNRRILGTVWVHAWGVPTTAMPVIKHSLTAKPVS